MSPRPIAVVVDGPPTPTWQARVLAALDASSALDVVEVRLAGRARGRLSQRVLTAVERRVFRLGADPLAPVAAAVRTAAASAPVPLLWLAEATGAPPAHDGELYELRHGGHAEPLEDAVRRALLAGESWLESELVLRRRPAREPLLVARTVSGLRPFSATLSCDLALWKLAAFVPREIERAPGLARPTPAPSPPPGPPAAMPLALRAALACMRVPLNRALFRRPWSIKVRRGAAGTAPTQGWDCRDEDQRLVTWRPGHVYADPFLFEHDGRHHLFCEDVPPGTGRGVISHTELRAAGEPAAPPAPVLEAPYHLSYPFVFAYEGALYLIPETSAVERVELYRAVDFPHTWEREAVLLDGLDAVDATLLAHDRRLWLFAGVAAPGASSLEELHLFWAERPQGPWHSHPGNPIVSDVRRARPAGAIQRWGETLVRPAQDGSRRYGWATSFQAIDVLSTTSYAEHEIARIEPDAVRGARATHTYAADRTYEAIDLRRREWRVRVPRPGNRRSAR
jgi:hypothetical protein